MATAAKEGPGKRDEFIGDGAGIRPFKLDKVYASTTAFLAAKGASGVNSASAEEGDEFYDSTDNCIKVYDGSAWQSSLNSNTLSGDATVTSAGVLRLSEEGIAQRAWSEDWNGMDTTDQVIGMDFDGTVHSGATGLLHHLYSPGGKKFAYFPLGAGQTIIPNIVAAGLDIGGDQTDDEGFELVSHCYGATGAPFVIGRDAAFYFLVKFQITDIDGLDTLFVGFRKVQAIQAAHADYTDKAGMGCSTAADPMAIKVIDALNNNADNVTDTTNTVQDATAIQFKILVSAAGVVTYQHDAVTPGTLAAPTATLAYTFDNGDPVIPCFHFLNTAALADGVIIHSWEVGYQ